MQYKVLFVDWDGTLSNSRFWSRWRNNPDDKTRYDLIQKVLFTEDKGRHLVKDWMRGLRGYPDILHYVSDATGIPYDNLVSELRYSAENMEYIDADSITIIQKLRNAGIKVVIATDNMDTFRNWTIPRLKLETLFDGILVSDTNRALKTDLHNNGTSMFFARYLSQSGVRPEETVLIDDNLDTKIVEQLGMNFLHVNESTVCRLFAMMNIWKND